MGKEKKRHSWFTRRFHPHQVRRALEREAQAKRIIAENAAAKEREALRQKQEAHARSVEDSFNAAKDRIGQWYQEKISTARERDSVVQQDYKSISNDIISSYQQQLRAIESVRVNVNYRFGFFHLNQQIEAATEELKNFYKTNKQRLRSAKSAYQKKYKKYLRDLNQHKLAKLNDIKAEKKQANSQSFQKLNSRLHEINKQLDKAFNNIQETFDKEIKANKRAVRAGTINLGIAIAAGVAACFTGGIAGGAVAASLVQTSVVATTRFVSGSEQIGFNVEVSFAIATNNNNNADALSAITAAGSGELENYDIFVTDSEQNYLLELRNRFSKKNEEIQSWKYKLEYKYCCPIFVNDLNKLLNSKIFTAKILEQKIILKEKSKNGTVEFVVQRSKPRFNYVQASGYVAGTLFGVVSDVIDGIISLGKNPVYTVGYGISIGFAKTLESQALVLRKYFEQREQIFRHLKSFFQAPVKNITSAYKHYAAEIKHQSINFSETGRFFQSGFVIGKFHGNHLGVAVGLAVSGNAAKLKKFNSFTMKVLSASKSKALTFSNRSFKIKNAVADIYGKTLPGVSVREKVFYSSLAYNANAQINLNKKLRALQKAQKKSVRTVELKDGRVRYYEAERRAHKLGQTRGAAYVTEYNRNTGQVRSWLENYDHSGNVNRVHPKMLDGQDLISQHYPPTGAELNFFLKNLRGAR